MTVRHRPDLLLLLIVETHECPMCSVASFCATTLHNWRKCQCPEGQLFAGDFTDSETQECRQLGSHRGAFESRSIDCGRRCRLGAKELAYDDLRDWIRTLEKNGELRRIRE